MTSEIVTTRFGLVLYWFSNYTLTKTTHTNTLGRTFTTTQETQKTEAGNFLESNVISQNNTEVPNNTSPENNTNTITNSTNNGTVIIPLSLPGLIVAIGISFVLTILIVCVIEKIDERRKKK